MRMPIGIGLRLIFTAAENLFVRYRDTGTARRDKECRPSLQQVLYAVAHKGTSINYRSP